LISRCNAYLQLGNQAGLASLEAFRDAGAALVEIKELLPRGEFGRVANERCRCSKQWRARLMKLALEWNEVLVALRWAEADGPELLRKACSVDGALQVLKAWRGAQNGSPKRGQGSRKPRSQSFEREIAQLKQQLSAAGTYITVLEVELAASAARRDLDPSERGRIRKVANLWLRPGTNGEGMAAAHKLRLLAGQLGWPIRDLLEECGIEGPARWTFSSTR
jgi:hypothetical protein